MASKFIGAINKAQSSVNKLMHFIGVITSGSPNGHTASAKGFINGEVRDMRIMSPYGIASCMPDGTPVQVIINDNNNATITGCFDKNKPSVAPGDMIIYDKNGNRIEMTVDGITFYNWDNRSLSFSEIYAIVHP